MSKPIKGLPIFSINSLASSSEKAPFQYFYFIIRSRKF